MSLTASFRHPDRIRVIALAGCMLLALSACHTTGTPVAASAPLPTAVPEIRPGVPAGYLSPAQVPDSVMLVPPAPASGSPLLANDEAVSQAALALHDTPRHAQAIEDANLKFPRAASTFSCALGVNISEQDTPALHRLLRRSFMDAAMSTDAAKKKYQRARPFTVNNKPSCTPEEEEALRKNGSYPSGHAAIGWMWGLVLAQAAPEATNALIARGRSFGESRLVCNVHWQTDIQQGRNMATATFARLQSDPVFRADMDAAKQEIATAREKNLPMDRDCTAEAAALAIPLVGAQ